MKKIFYLTLILFTVFISACKKDKKVTPVKTTDSTAIKAAALDLLKDSLYLYTKETYLWHDQLPTYDAFKPRSFTAADPFTALQNEMTALSQYAINPTTNKPYEYYVPSPGHAKYSFVDDGTVGNELNGTKGDFGFDYNYNDVNDIRIVYVYPGSPAGLAGLTRGCQITAINDIRRFLSTVFPEAKPMVPERAPTIILFTTQFSIAAISSSRLPNWMAPPLPLRWLPPLTR